MTRITESQQFGSLLGELDSTKKAIADSGFLLDPPVTQSKSLSTLDDSVSLIDACRRALELGAAARKPKLRFIHHLACTGGTLIAKVLASLPNTYVLSEVHPNSTLRQTHDLFAPSDLPWLANWAEVPDASDLSELLISEGLNTINNWVCERGGSLVIRDHSQSDFFKNDAGLSSQSSVKGLTASISAEVRSVVTVRNPVDSYSSLLKNGWVTFEPGTFENYCLRYHHFLDEFESLRVVRYEDFVDDPSAGLRTLCDELELPFSDFATDIFSLQAMSGDSGRSGNVISIRNRQRHTDVDFGAPCIQSLFKRLGYEFRPRD